ncbi:hypothetical protein CN510_07660 [Priestia megaterium]|uniref:acyltransferase family protein n=1 Tax=Priestia megaterium TaxID=1404 RepID=UPI000BF904D4|nr:acyltransferase [Priestia megaterium]PET00261.1 hypothetical protein CN510_07660 [Priestia megaterium]
MKKNLAIHGLRGLSALMVIIFHIHEMAVNGGFFEKKNENIIFHYIDNFGLIGVNLFFMISGFLIVSSLEKHRDIKAFFVNRLIRIYPVFLVLHIIIFLIGPLIHYEWLGDTTGRSYLLNFLSNFFMLPGLFPLPIAQKNAWSLSYELFFYILSATFFVTCVYQRKQIYKRISVIVLTIICLIVMFLHPRFVFFAIGTLVYYSYRYFKTIYIYRSIYALNGIIIMGILLTIYSNKGGAFFLSSILSAVLFYLIVIQEGILAKLLNNKVLLYFGTISYSFYLIHPFVMFPLKVIFSSGKIEFLNGSQYLYIFLFGILSLIFSTLAAYLSYRIIEQWLTNKIKRVLDSYKSRKNTFASFDDEKIIK